MTNRTSAAKGTTTYSYDNEGNLLNVAYPTSPSISFAYDAMNRMTNMTDAVGTSTFTYTAAGQLQSEDGPWSSDTITYSYNNRLRSGFTLQEPIGSSLSQTYGYDASRRLTNITSTAGAFTYAYDPARNLQVQKLTLPNYAYITNAYDTVSRLTDTWLKNSSGTILNYHGYLINKANQRSRQTRFNYDYVDYTYDAAGQLKTASGKESGGTPHRYNEQLGYSYDPAGNLLNRTNNTLIQNFVVNSLNELTNVKSSGKITVEGNTSAPASSVTVNGTNAAIYSDATFAATNMPLASSYTAIAHDAFGRADTNTITLTLSTNVIFRYDGNGNLTNDNLCTFQYDDENQLTNVWASNAWKSAFAYDGLHRRRAETNYIWSAGAWVKSNERRFLYDGNLVVEERDATNQSQVFYTRGRDLSGTIAGAGGIGGLLARTPTTDYLTSSSAAHAFYFSDANGNVTTLTGTNQTVLAKYLYDAFGNILSSSGPLADINLYRFSSKEIHLNSRLIYFGLRFYSPSLQRWINRDPIAENGGLNLYAYVLNDPVNLSDPLGLDILDSLNNHAAESYQRGGVFDKLEGVVANGIEATLDTLIGAQDVKDSAIKSGMASADPCHRKRAWGYGALAAGTILINAIPGEGQAEHIVYVGLDKAGIIRYVGITSRDLEVREAEHIAQGGGKQLLDYVTVAGAEGMTKTEARIAEQKLINANGGVAGGQLLNKRNSIAPGYWPQHGIK